MGKTASKIETRDFPANWMYTAKLQSKYENDNFNQLSSGMKSVNGNTIVRTRKDLGEIDAARWSRGFTNGKHVFEIAFPRYMRGKHASVGLGTKNAAIVVSEKPFPIGSRPDIWGIELTTRKVLHNDKGVIKYPRSQKLSIPDRFYMYVDLDSRCLSFGNDEEYFGTAITEIMFPDVPVYPMVTCSVYGATITMVYRGKGKEVIGPLRKKR